ncbi:transposable element Tcb1 transposase [Trichonephila clavipes]|nr:transposable element Tcb1 transposase [Trichonephila clavipes]
MPAELSVGSVDDVDRRETGDSPLLCCLLFHPIGRQMAAMLEYLCLIKIMHGYFKENVFLHLPAGMGTDIYLEISEELGIAQSVISRLWQRFQDDGNVSRCYSTGRPRVTTPNEDRYLAVTTKRNRRSTASNQSRQLSSATRTTVSRQTVYRRLGHIGLYARRPVR